MENKTRLEAEVNTLNTTVENLNNIITEKNNKITELKNRVAELESQVANRVDLEELKAIVAELKAVLAESEMRNLYMISNITKELINLAISKLELENRVAELESQVVNRVDLEELKTIVAELKAVLSE